jgi:hypothetical protein
VHTSKIVDYIQFKKGIKMNIIEEYKNPCRNRYVARYNSLLEDIQKKIDDINKLPKEELYLKPIKRKRNPVIHEGTIFAIKLPEEVYFFGKVICSELALPMIEKGYFVVFFFRQGSRDMKRFPLELSADNILIGLMILGNALWKNGTCYTVDLQPLTKREREINYGFYKFNYRTSESSKIEDLGKVIDVKGNVLQKEPAFLGLCAYTTIYGIESAFRKEIIIAPSLINDLEY